MDPDHLFHEKAHDWWQEHHLNGWASCPITENGVVRILSHPGYSPDRPFSCMEILDRLREFIRHSDHVFIAKSVSIRNENHFQIDVDIRTARITDLYLLGLAVTNRMRLVTFDQGISLNPVANATRDHLVTLR